MDNLIARIEQVARLKRRSFDQIPGWANDDHAASFQAFQATCRTFLKIRSPLRIGQSYSGRIQEICRIGSQSGYHADSLKLRKLFEDNFQPFQILPLGTASPVTAQNMAPGFITGYYEPEVAGSLSRTAQFTEPLYSLPPGHTVLKGDGNRQELPQGLSAAIIEKNGILHPYPDRAAITNGALLHLIKPIAWVRDGIEAFMIHVQGSARIRLSNGQVVRVKYAGKNGHPYTSIGRYLSRTYNIPPAELTLIHLKKWIRAAGQDIGQLGRLIMEENKSFIFFALDTSIKMNQGPIGAAGVNLLPLRSIAIDSNLWPYGLPFWIDAIIPWKTETSLPFRRLLIAQDTGSAIVGPARADIFFGSGLKAGRLAGAIRHRASFHVFLPK